LNPADAKSSQFDLEGASMNFHCRQWRFALGVLLLLETSASLRADGPSQAAGTPMTLKGSMVCNGACIPDPNREDLTMVVFAIDGTREIRDEVEQVVKDFYPDDGLDAEAANGDWLACLRGES
jgi:hypothetical protein